VGIRNNTISACANPRSTTLGPIVAFDRRTNGCGAATHDHTVHGLGGDLAERPPPGPLMDGLLGRDQGGAPHRGEDPDRTSGNLSTIVVHNPVSGAPHAA
jgi:hypothetical protein